MEIAKKFVIGKTEHSLKIYGSCDEPLFSSSQVAQLLDIKQIHRSISHYESNEKTEMVVKTNGGDQKVSMLTEQGLYRLLYSTRTQVGKTFRKWVYTVIKELRTNGVATLKGTMATVDLGTQSNVDKSDLILKQFKNKNVFYIMKVADLQDGKQVFKIGKTNGNLNERFTKHMKDFQELSTNEGQITITYVWECVNPHNVEHHVKQALFPKYRYQYVVPSTLKVCEELVLVDHVDLKLSKLYDIVQTTLEEEQKVSNEALILRGKLEFAKEQLQQKDDYIRELLQGKNERIKITTNSYTQTEVIVHQVPVVEIPQIDKKRNIQTVQIQKIDIKTLECIKVYDDMTAVLQEHVAVSKSSISNAIKNAIPSCGAYWKYVEENQEDIKQVINFTPKATTKSPIQPIAKLNSDKSQILTVYQSQVAGAKDLGIEKCQFSQSVNKKRKYKGFYYIKWSDVDEHLKIAYLNTTDNVVCECEKQWTIRTHVKTGKVEEFQGAPRDVAKRLRIFPCAVDKSVKNGGEHLGYRYRVEIRKTKLYLNDFANPVFHY